LTAAVIPYKVRIGSSLKIAGTGTLNGLFLATKAKKSHYTFAMHFMCLKQVPMSLLCPQQIAQQTGKVNNGFH
jgi:hypothetical protein